MINEDATVTERDGSFYVVDSDTVIAGPFTTNAEAWTWIDRHAARQDFVSHSRSVHSGKRQER
jgi:hypothetical protein